MQVVKIIKNSAFYVMSYGEKGGWLHCVDWRGWLEFRCLSITVSLANLCTVTQASSLRFYSTAEPLFLSSEFHYSESLFTFWQKLKIKDV